MIGFGNYTKKAEATTITSLTDNRLVKIDPQEPGFFDEVLNFKSTNEDINTFIEAVAEVKGTSLEAFYRVMYDPTEAGDHMVVFQKGKRPAVGHSYNWWVETASKMSPVEGRQWHIATEYQYYAFLVWLINQLVKMANLLKRHCIRWCLTRKSWDITMILKIQQKVKILSLQDQDVFVVFMTWQILLNFAMLKFGSQRLLAWWWPLR